MEVEGAICPHTPPHPFQIREGDMLTSLWKWRWRLAHTPLEVEEVICPKPVGSRGGDMPILFGCGGGNLCWRARAVVAVNGLPWQSLVESNGGSGNQRIALSFIGGEQRRQWQSRGGAGNHWWRATAVAINGRTWQSLVANASGSGNQRTALAFIGGEQRRYWQSTDGPGNHW